MKSELNHATDYVKLFSIAYDVMISDVLAPSSIARARSDLW